MVKLTSKRIQGVDESMLAYEYRDIFAMLNMVRYRRSNVTVVFKKFSGSSILDPEIWKILDINI